MKLAVLAVGKLKEKYLRDAAAEYQKRIGRFAELEIVEIADEAVPERYSPAQAQQALMREGERLLAKITPRDYVVALAIDAKQHSSESFAAQMQEWIESGRRIVFMIGGSLGLSAEVLSRSDARVSLSAMTFPHQLARIVLLEQMYRAFKINNNEVYHK